jgi:hypothetical protein
MAVKPDPFLIPGSSSHIEPGFRVLLLSGIDPQYLSGGEMRKPNASE